MLADTDVTSEYEPIKLGKKVELKYIPFAELAIPWNASFDMLLSKKNEKIAQSHFLNTEQNNNGNANASRTLNNLNLNALKCSIAQYGLLKPFEVAEMHERLDYFYGKGRYLVMDGQRRYFAVRELLKLPTEDDERKQREGLRTEGQHDSVLEGEIQAQEQFDRLSIRDHVLIPCLVYPYTTLLQMVRHSIEDKKFSEKPSKEELLLADRMGEEGVKDLDPDDLRVLWKTRSLIEEEKRFIEKTLQEIRNSAKKDGRDHKDEAGKFELGGKLV